MVDFPVKFECNRSTRILLFVILDLICDVINYCASRLLWEKLSVYDQIVLKNL